MVAVPPLIWYNLFKIKIFYIQRGKITMKLNYAAEYRAAAREALRGKWPMAVLVGLVASILTGFQINEPAFSVNLNLETDANSLPFADLFY